MVEVVNEVNGRRVRVNAVVNGSMHTVLPRGIAVELGLDTVGVADVGTCCSIAKVNYGYASLAVNGRLIRTRVLITDDVDKVVIGIIDLEKLLSDVGIE
jgi:hypothetical protein